ncbi:30S ribosomal protein S13 [Chytridium lagenaria]|nr:30S ribosomal protein S13 [Chytridium lagenaria]
MFLLGVNLPDNKIVSIALRSIYGIGQKTSESLCHKLLIHRHCKLKDLPEEKVTQLEVTDNIQNLVQIGSYKGMRHKAGLPVHGARTRTNARTAKKLNGKMLGQSRGFSR